VPAALWANLLFLRPGTREHFMAALAKDFPEQLNYYEQLYAHAAYLGRSTRSPYGIRSRRWRRNSASATGGTFVSNPSRR
jgi:hypothetical protein